MKCLNESILNSFKEAFLLEDYKSARTKLVEKGASEDEADSLIARHKELKKLNRLDKSLIDIDILVKNFSPEEIKTKLFNISTQTKSEIKKRVEGKIVAENDEYWVYKIDTPEEAYRFHGLTNWCICSGTESQARSHFANYLNGFKNVFYFFVRKNITDPEDEWNYIALQRDGDEDVYWSMIDESYNFFDIPVNLPEFNKPPLEPLTVEEKITFSGLKKNADGKFDVDGDFNLNKHKYLIVDGKLSVKFGKVSGHFECRYCDNLTSLEGCPEEVGKDFDCSFCDRLTSLEGCPEKVGRDFNCSHCEKLISLEGCPKEVGEYFCCGNCENLTSLKGCPRVLGGSFNCSYCDCLTNLEGGPRTVGGCFNCSYCYDLTSLRGCPEKVDGDFDCSYCERLTSLRGCPKEVNGVFNCSHCDNLMNFEGCPREVSGFNCEFCGKLTSLKESPEKVNGYFSCSNCHSLMGLEGCPKLIGWALELLNCKNLTSLKGCPEKIRGEFNCSGCKKLTSLEGCPKEVGAHFDCSNCGIEFTEDDVESLCVVSGQIFC